MKFNSQPGELSQWAILVIAVVVVEGQQVTAAAKEKARPGLARLLYSGTSDIIH